MIFLSKVVMAPKTSSSHGVRKISDSRRESVHDRSLLQHSSTQHLHNHRVADPTPSQWLHLQVVPPLSDDFLYSSRLKPSCPSTKHPGPITSSCVLATEVLWSVSRRKRSKSESVSELTSTPHGEHLAKRRVRMSFLAMPFFLAWVLLICRDNTVKILQPAHW